MRNADSCEQQAQVVVDLRDGAHGGAWISAGGFLVNRDRGRQPVDAVNVRLFGLPQELPGVGRQGLDVSPLPLRVDRVKSKRRFSRS